MVGFAQKIDGFGGATTYKTKNLFNHTINFKDFTYIKFQVTEPHLMHKKFLFVFKLFGLKENPTRKSRIFHLLEFARQLCLIFIDTK